MHKGNVIIAVVTAVVFLLLGCKKESIPIKYIYGSTFTTLKYSMIQRGYRTFVSKKTLELNVKLAINTDSTFVREGCGSIVLGKAYVENDTLFLSKRTQIRRMDSLVYQYEKPFPVEKYHISKDGVLKSEIVISNGKLKGYILESRLILTENAEEGSNDSATCPPSP